MASDVANIRLGQCDVTYNSQLMGHTKGGVEITISNDVTEVMVDKYGVSPARAFYKGTRVEVKTTLSEFAYDILKQVVNGMTKTTGTSIHQLDVGGAAGASLAGALLTLHPIDKSGTGYDIKMHKAIVIGEVKLPFKIDEETTYEVTFLGLIDESKTDGKMILQIGTSN